MFTSITWQLFFTASLLIVGGYYSITTLLVYRHEIIQWLRSHNQKTISQERPPSAHSHPLGDVMGGVNLENTRLQIRTSLPAEEVAIAASDEEPETIHTPIVPVRDDLLIGSVADLLQEIKTLINFVAESRLNQAETHSLFHALLTRYPQIENTPYQEAIILFIRNEGKDHFMFDFTTNQVMTWWSTEGVTTK